MEPDAPVESALVNKRQLDLERPRPGRPAPPWPPSGKIARARVEKNIMPKAPLEKDIEPETAVEKDILPKALTKTLAEPSRASLWSRTMPYCELRAASQDAEPLQEPQLAEPSRPMVQDHAVLRAASFKLQAKLPSPPRSHHPLS